VFFLSEFTGEHSYYLIYMFAILLLLGYGYIGATSSQKEAIVFYVGLLGIPSLIYVFFDWVTK